MTEMRQHSYDLVLMSTSRDQRADRFAASQVVQQLKFILNPYGAAGNIDLLDGDKPGLRLTAFIMVSAHR